MKKFDPSYAQKKMFPMVRLPAGSAGYDPPEEWEAQCDFFETEGKVTLSAEARECLWRCVRVYIHLAYVELMLPNANEQRRRFQAIESLSSQLLAQLDTDENPDCTGPVLKAYGALKGEGFDRLPDILQRLNEASTAALADFDQHIKGAAGRAARPRFHLFITTLETVYSFAGGTVSTAWSPNAPGGEKRWTPYIRFCLAVYEYAITQAPPELQETIRAAAFGEAVNGVWKKNKSDPSAYDNVLIRGIAHVLEGENP
jgi:hypothetical protein